MILMKNIPKNRQKFDGQYFNYKTVCYNWYVPCIHRDKPEITLVSFRSDKCSLYTQG